MTQLHELTAVAQRSALQRGEISSRELTLHYLDRSERYGEQLGAFVTVFPDEALAAADRSDRRRCKGGLLDGLPLVLKDLQPTAGLRTTMGCAALTGWVPTEDAPAVGALRSAGAVVTAKTNTPEFGPVCYTETTVAGTAVTPYDHARSASGSSGGSAAAVAARLAPLGHGSDGLGSLRTPAANCGLVGFKPSRGRLLGTADDWLSLSVEGPVARTVGDAALLLDAIGPSRSELWSADPGAAGRHQRAARTPPPARLRVGRLVDPRIDAEVDPDCLRACARTAYALEDLGHEVLDLPTDGLPHLGELWPSIRAVLQARLALVVPLLVPRDREDELMPFTRWLVEGGRELSGLALVAAQTALAIASSRWLSAVEGVDLVLSPTTTAPPTLVGELRLDDAERSAAAMLRWSAFTPWANLCGLPAVSLPVHRTASGLPIGAQLSGSRHRDDLLLGVAGSLEGVFGWAADRPALSDGTVAPVRP